MFARTRNIAIVLLLAAVVDLVPGGGEAAATIGQVVALVFLATLGWFASIMYRQHRGSIYSFGDQRRAALYVSIGALVLLLSALWRVTGLTAVLALVIGGLAIYTIFAIVWSARQY